jgi:hypothetical protein
MTKRAYQKFKRNERDFYATPESAVLPLLRFLPPRVRVDEPCAGAGDLIRHLEHHGINVIAQGDIKDGSDALAIKGTPADIFVTNPPWARPILHKLIVHLSDIAPTWLLFDADWMHTKQSIPYMRRCRKIVSVGRISWMGNGISGFDNCAWYLFDATQGAVEGTQFIGRGA